MKIQIVDDNDQWCDFATETLVNAGHEIVVADADLVLLSSRRLDEAPACPFIVFSFHLKIREAARAYCAGAWDYAAKDFRAAMLLATVADVEKAGVTR